ncbi:MAG: hypothetical protein EOP92_29435 [Lysobacteraceae bacterium]|nr:MAG: hypothetical protein EOP92_29435 [Xanthomonadaceae bacterium]
MKAFLAALIALLPLGAIANEAKPAPSPYVSSQPGLRVSATRGHAEGTFEVAAVISDAGTGKVLASPTMTVRAGEWARASMGAPGAEVEFSATVDPSGQLVAFLAKASQADGDRKTYSGTSLVMP